MKPSNQLNKRFVIEANKTPKPKPNKQLLKQLKSKSTKWINQQEFYARKQYLDEFEYRIKYNDDL